MRVAADEENSAARTVNAAIFVIDVFIVYRSNSCITWPIPAPLSRCGCAGRLFAALQELNLIDGGVEVLGLDTLWTVASGSHADALGPESSSRSGTLE